MNDNSKIPGTEMWQDRDWTRSAQQARENQALLKVFAKFIEEHTAASIEAATLEDREKSRAHVITARLLQAALDAEATRPVK